LGKHFSLTTNDGHTLGAYRADPAGKPKGAMVVAQEIFGVNSHIRNVCDRLAAQGYVAVAPALFDRFVRDFQSGYSPDEVAHARSYLGKIDWPKMLLDIQAGIDEVKAAGPVGVIGFCMGGSAAFLAATRLSGVSAAVAYYGGQIVKFADEKPKCPVQMNFGETDASIPMSDVEIIKEKRKDCEIYTYPAGHGFYCDERASFDDASAKLAWQRTLDFLEKNMK
jgi:carboxymethylenebutenolidase